MRSRLARLCLTFLIVLSALPSMPCIQAQVDMARQLEDRNRSKEYDDSDKDRHGNLSAYQLVRRVGDLRPAFVDTLKLNYYRRASAEGRSLAEAYTGSYSSPYQSKIYFDRPQDSWGDLFFLMPISHLLYKGERQRWFDTKVPYTFMSYSKSGSADDSEETFHTLFSSNFGKKFNAGGQFDYDNARGVYAFSHVKNVSYRIFGSYTGDRYEAFLSFGNTNALMAENGGLEDDRYITQPEDFSDGRRQVRNADISTRFTSTWNRLVYGHGRLYHRYSLGFHEQDSIVRPDTTIIRKTFVPVTSFFHELSYEKGRRHFYSRDPDMVTLFPEPVIPRPGRANYYPDDRFSLIKVDNTVGVQLLEGFHKWAKIGVAAFVSFDWKQYFIPPYIATEPNLTRSENTTYVGGRLQSNSFKYFRYNVRGEVGVAGAQAGDVLVTGDAYTYVPIMGKKVELRLDGMLKNSKPGYLLREYRSPLYQWSNDFKMTQSLRVGGELRQKDLGSRGYAHFETLQNPIYVGIDAKPAQYEGNMRILSVGASQLLRWKFLNWENEVAWQNTSDPAVIPLPELSVFSSLYAKFLVAKVMTVQVGVDAKFHTAYYAPYYDPTTQFFTPQGETKIGGGTPLMSAFVNAHLKRARFYVRYYNLSAQLFKPNYFTMPHYPLNPPRIVYGIAIDLRN